jgi:hypothetical protein
MANTLRDEIRDEIMTNFPPHREKWMSKEMDNLVDNVCWRINKFMEDHLDIS